MKRKAAAEYVVEVNGMPDYAKIPKPVLESVAKKFLENILKRRRKMTRDKAMEEIRNSSNKLVCRLDKARRVVEIVIKGCKTTIRVSRRRDGRDRERENGVSPENQKQHIRRPQGRQWKANLKRFLCRLFVCGKKRLCGFPNQIQGAET